MLALILRAGWHPSFLIGGDVNEVGTNVAYDARRVAVVEADESDGTFLELYELADAAIVTNVEPDHLDHYGGFARLTRVFEDFLRGVPGHAGVCADDPIAAASRPRSVRGPTAGTTRPTTTSPATRAAGPAAGSRSSTPPTGARAASSARSSCRSPAGTTRRTPQARRPSPSSSVSRSTRSCTRWAAFGGVARRFQFRGEADGVTLVDDYAHLPSEVRAALRAAREAAGGASVAVFQPHRYTRTASLWRDFADVFVDADAVVLTDIYAAGEAPCPGVSGRRLVLRAVLDAHPGTAVMYLPRRADVVRHALSLAHPGDIL